MCRSIKCLAHFEPPASEEEIREAAVQFVRKLSGARRPSRANEAAFERRGGGRDRGGRAPLARAHLQRAAEEPGGGGA